MMKGIVVDVHHADHSVDVLLADGRRIIGAQVLTPNGSARSGTVDLPPVPTRPEKWDVREPNGQDQIAVVDFIGGAPVVVGFLFPQISQMTFDGPVRIYRHHSDVVQQIDADGNIDIQHPSGWKLRIGETPDHAVTAGKNADKSLAVDRNTARRPYVHLSMAGGTASLLITPDGAVSLTTQQTVEVDAAGAVTVTTPASVTLDTPVTHVTGDVIVDGDVTASGISLVHHIHDGVMSGPAVTGQPVG